MACKGDLISADLTAPCFPIHEDMSTDQEGVFRHRFNAVIQANGLEDLSVGQVTHRSSLGLVCALIYRERHPLGQHLFSPPVKI